MRVLLIEDDSATAQGIEPMLKSKGFNIYSTDLGEEGIDLGKLYDHDMIVLDLTQPDMHGYDVLEQLRVARVNTPILILSGAADIDTKVRGLGHGADDYTTKPFNKDELIARINTIVANMKGAEGEQPPRPSGRAVLMWSCRWELGDDQGGLVEGGHGHRREDGEGGDEGVKLGHRGLSQATICEAWFSAAAAAGANTRAAMMKL